MNGRSWFRLPLLAALVSLVSASAPAFAQAVAIDPFDLPPGKTVTIEFEVTVDSPMPPGDAQVCNQGTFSADLPAGSFVTDDPDTGAAGDATCTNILLIADLSVTKSDGATTEVPGTPVTYTIVASNAGPATVIDGVVADTFPASLSGCSTTAVGAGSASGFDAGPFAGNINDTGITLPAGASVTYTTTCNINPAATGSLANTVIISSAGTSDPTTGNNSATDTDTLTPSTDVAITKTDGATTEVPGTAVTYTIVASNSGPSTATGVTVADTFPGILSGCSTASVAAGGATGNDGGPVAGNINDTGITLPPSSSVTFTATCNIAANATGSLANTATITSATTDPTPANNSATDTDTLNPQADLSITKTDGSATEVPGTPVTYTIVASNSAGPSVATGVTVSDTFPAALTGCSTTSVAAGGATGNDPGPAAGDINDSGITLPVGGSVTYTATCTVDQAATGTLVNTASVSTAVIDPVPGNNSATDSDTLAASADVSVSKTDGVASEVPGTPVTYTITLGNAGPSTATSVVASDTFPAVLTGCSTTSVAAGGATGNDTGPALGNISDGGITLPVGSSVTYTATCNIDPNATGSLANTATVSSATTDPVPGNNSSTDTDSLLPSADVQITKTDGSPSVSPGAPIVYTIVASNSGPSTATGVTVSDTFVAALTGCSTTSVAAGGATGNDPGPTLGNINDGGITLPPGSSVTYTASCTVDGAATGTLDNTASITSGTTDPVPGNNSATDSNTVLPLDFGDAPTAAQSGFAASYPTTIALDGARHVATGLLLGAARDIETNGQPTAAADGDDATGTDDEDGVTFDTALVACQAGSATVTASAGGQLNVWIDWNRNGDWIDQPNENLAPQTLVAGPNTVNFTVPCSAIPGTTFARFRFSTALAANPTGQAADGEVEDYAVTVTASADLAITKTDGLTSAVPGQTGITYTIVASNTAGPSPMSGVTVADTFPVVLTGCSTTSVAAGGATGNDAGPFAGNINDTGITLPVGGSVTYTTTCAINPSASGTLSNTATVATTLPNTSDPVAANDSATDNTTLNPLADVAISKTDGTTNEVPGTPVTYTIVASNAGPSTATSVTVADTFPGILSGCSTTSVAAGGATGNEAGPTAGNVNDSGITLPPGSSVSYTATCNIDVAATGTLVNTATIASATPDGVPGNNSATDSDTLNPEVDVAITKTDGATDEVPGTQVIYTITVTNTAGPSIATGVTVSDTFPASLTGCSTTSVAAGGATGNDAGPVAGNLNDGGITLPVGGSVTYTATCNIDPAATGSLANTASASVPGTITDTVPGNNSATDTDTLTPSADVGVTKTDLAASEVPGTPVSYNITVTNIGPSTATGVTLTDNFPAILTGCSTTSVAANGATGNDPGPTPGNINDGGMTLPPSSSVTYTANCNIDPAATGSLANTATVTSGVADPNTGNDSATDTDTLAPSADVAITKTDGVTLVAPGDPVIYTLVASNAGPSTSVNVNVADNFPPTLLACSTTSVAAGGATGNDTGPIGGNISDGGIVMPPGSTVTYTASCTLDVAATGSLVNTASISSGTADPVAGNNSATDTDTIQPQDYGDAPTAAQSGFASSYPVTLAQTGARHGATGPTLGAARDSETDGQPTAGADGDDVAGSPDDEDGVTIGALVACEPGSATATASAPGRLSAWLDWNRDGDWSDTGETIATDQLLAAGPNPVSFSVPCDASVGTSYARFRFATATGLGIGGQAVDGEVEDYSVAITKLTDLAITKVSDTNPVAANQVFNYQITVQNLGPSNSIGFTVTDTLPAASSAVFVSANGTGWSCGAPVGLVLTCTHGALADGATTAVLTVQMQVAAAPTPPVFDNTATVSSTEPNPDTGGNNTSVATVSTDVTPPTVSQVSASHGAAAGDIQNCETVAAKVREIAVRFSELLAGGPGTGANDPANYLLVRRGADADFDTTSCAGGTAGDIAIPIDQAVLQPNVPSAPSSTVRLSVNGVTPLEDDLYRLIACDTLTDAANNNLDGDGVGGEGGDLVRTFRIDSLNLLDNGHFDCDQSSWTAQSVNFIASEDHQASPNSGAARSTTSDAFINQCTDLAGGVAPFDAYGRIRIDGSILVGWSLSCVFYTGPNCTGAASESSVSFATTSTGGAWIAAQLGPMQPIGAVSANCGFDYGNLTGSTADMDAIGLRGTGEGLIFNGNFETGDLSQWN
jgi:uncharacterized repeat protein (TIGR01451 family)